MIIEMDEMEFVVQEFLSIRVKMELVIQRFIVGGIGAMAVLHLVPGWNNFGPAAGLLLGPGPHTSGPRPDAHLGQGTYHIWARENCIWTQDQVSFEPRTKSLSSPGPNCTWAKDQFASGPMVR